MHVRLTPALITLILCWIVSVAGGRSGRDGPGRHAARAIAADLGAEPGEYVLATIHRPENTDDPQHLQAILDELGNLGLPVLFPLHPRTRLAAARHGLTPALDRLQVIPRPTTAPSSGWPSGRLIVSDCGGVQEECMVLKRPLIVVMNSTKRPGAIDAGFAHLLQPWPAIGELGRRLISDRTLGGRLAATPCPFGDGRASERITEVLRSFLH